MGLFSMFKKDKGSEKQMEQVKLAVFYYSAGGTNEKLAKWAEEAGKAAGAEVRVRQVAKKDNLYGEQATSEDIEWADAIIFSTPTRFGMMAAQMKEFIDDQGGLWATGKTVNKVVSGMSSSQNVNGGQEATILSLYTTLMHWGAIIAAPGYTDNSVFAAGGNPYGTSVTVDQEGNMVEDVEATVKHQATRTVNVAKWVKEGQ